MNDKCEDHAVENCFYCVEYAPLLRENRRLQKYNEVLDQRYHAYVAESERLINALERMDDRKNPMLPRSEMARIAKEALDYDGG